MEGALFPSHGDCADPTQSAAWNRGAYLVQSAAHCGSCHTPRNLLGAEKKGRQLAGGEAEGWHAPPSTPPRPRRYRGLRRRSISISGMAARTDMPFRPVPWWRWYAISQRHPNTRYGRSRLTSLRTRRKTARAHAARRTERGPRRRRCRSLRHTVASGAGGRQAQVGRGIYTDACASCHGAGRLTSSGGTALHLAMGSASTSRPAQPHAHYPRWHHPCRRRKRSWMPGFAGALTDDQIVTLVRYLRADLAKAPQWPDVPRSEKSAADGNSPLYWPPDSRPHP